MSGYVRIHRSLLGHPAFINDGEAMAFAWLIIRAQWKAGRVRYKGRVFNLQRGQVAVSQRDMAAALGREKSNVERMWMRFRAEAMIEVSYEAGAAVITICNYDEYQSQSETGEAVREAPNEAPFEAGARQARGTEQRREEREEGIKEEGIARAARESNLNGKKATKPEARFEFDGEETIMRTVREEFAEALDPGTYAIAFCDPKRPVRFVREEGRLVARCKGSFTHMMARDHEFRLSVVAKRHGFTEAWIREGESP